MEMNFPLIHEGKTLYLIKLAQESLCVERTWYTIVSPLVFIFDQMLEVEVEEPANLINICFFYLFFLVNVCLHL